MKRFHPTFLAGVVTTILCGSGLAQDGSTQIHAQRRAVALAAAAQPPSLTQAANEPSEKSFPSLKPRTPGPERSGEASDEGPRSSKIAAPTITVVSSLAVVLGLFAALVWGSRKFGNGSLHSGSLPKDVIQSLGSTAIDTRTRVTMLRCGNRILVLAQSAGTTQTLCEVTDPQEVQSLVAACLGSSKHDFASTLQSIEKEKTSRGYLGSETYPDKTPARRRLFASA